MALATLKALRTNLNTVLLGKEQVVDLLLIALATGGHVLLEDVPGVGKTVLAKSFSRSIDVDFSRIQGTPDLLPSDLSGVEIFNPDTQDFAFRKGPLFGSCVLVDEINRATPKVQSVLLEAMAEGQVTVGDTTHSLPEPHWLIATANPMLSVGTYELLEAQLDRFLCRLALGFPEREFEVSMLRDQSLEHPLNRLQAVASAEEMQSLRQAINEVQVAESILQYIVDCVRFSRTGFFEGLPGASPRASIALMQASKGAAFLAERNYVTPDDVRLVAPGVLNHRLGTTLSVEAGSELVLQLLEQVKIPV